MLNFGLHTHVELSGPSLELITIFEIFGQNWQKNWVGQFGRLQYPDMF